MAVCNIPYVYICIHTHISMAAERQVHYVDTARVMKTDVSADVSGVTISSLFFSLYSEISNLSLAITTSYASMWLYCPNNTQPASGGLWILAQINSLKDQIEQLWTVCVLSGWMCTQCLLLLSPCKRVGYQSLHQLNFYTALGGWGDKQVMRDFLV